MYIHSRIPENVIMAALIIKQGYCFTDHGAL